MRPLRCQTASLPDRFASRPASPIRFLVLVFGLFFLGLVSGVVVDGSVYDKFDGGDEEVRVVVTEKAFAGVRVSAMFDDNVEKIVERDGRYVALVSEGELALLRVSGRVEEIVRDIPLKTFMQDVVGQTSVSSVWGLQEGGIDLTGVSRSVCILDSGINASHSDFSGRVLAEHCYCSVSGSPGCCPNGLTEDSSAIDDYGHGTHVAGIVGASGGISGMATEVGLVVVKIMNGSGDGSSFDLDAGIQWCIDNADVYNISVISASLGDPNTKMTTSCDEYRVDTTNKINLAVANNISVTIATGNVGWTDGISWPSCVVNATSVGAVDKSDVLYYNRNSLVKLLGIGVGINSTCLAGGYCLSSGTSMATPGIAGAIAILSQYLGLTGRTRTPSEIEDILYDNGDVVSELGNDYSRIDVYASVLSLDNVVPSVGLVLPTNDSIDMDVNRTFVCNVTDWQLANVTLNIWNSSGLYYNVSGNVSGVVNESFFNVSNFSEGDYFWNCLGVDVLGNSDFASVNFSFVVGGISINLLLPEMGSYSALNDTNFSCRIISNVDNEILNVSFYLWNGSGEVIYNSSENVSGFDNTTVFNYSFVDDGNYSWNCLGVNNGSNESWGDSNFSFFYDSVAPVISSLGESVSSSGVTIGWTTDEVANSSVGGGVSGSSADYVMGHSVVISGLAASTTYAYVVSSCDRAGNCVNTSDGFTTSAVSSSSSSSSGGGSSSGGSFSGSVKPNVYEVTSVEVTAGYTRSLKKNDKVNFSIFDFEGGRHLLSVNSVEVDYVNLTIASEPVNFVLGVGQSVKLNLTSVVYYDLFVKLNTIVGGVAELTIQLINEPIEVRVVEVTGEVVVSEVEVVGNYLWVVVVLVFVLVGIVFVVLKRGKGLRGFGRKKRNGGKKK